MWLRKKHFPLTSTKCFSPGPGVCAVFCIVLCKKESSSTRQESCAKQSLLVPSSWVIWELEDSHKILVTTSPFKAFTAQLARHLQTTLCLLGSNITPLTQLALAKQRHFGWCSRTHHWHTGRNQLWWQICWEDIGTNPLRTDSTQSMTWVSSPQFALEGQRFKRNCIVPTLLLTHIFIRISYYQAFLNSSLKVLWRLVSEHPSPSNTFCFWALLESPLIPNSLTLLADAVKELGSGGGSVMLGLDSRLEWLAKGSSFLSTILNKKRNQMFQYCTSEPLLYTECGLHSSAVWPQSPWIREVSGLSARSFLLPKE